MLEERAEDQHRRRLVDHPAATVAGQPRLDELAVRVDGREPLVDVDHPNAGALCEGCANLPGEARRTILRAVELFRDRALWSSMQKRGMKSDVSWSRSAARYADLYRRLAVGTA